MDWKETTTVLSDWSTECLVDLATDGDGKVILKLWQSAKTWRERKKRSLISLLL